MYIVQYIVSLKYLYINCYCPFWIICLYNNLTDVDKASCYSTRTCTKLQSSFIAMWACCRTLAPCGCAGGVGSLIRPPLAEQLWERVVEELITGPAGQSHCQSQLLVNKPAKNREGKKKKTEFRERFALQHILNFVCSHMQNSFRIPLCDIMRHSGAVPLLQGSERWGFVGTLLFLCALLMAS